MTLIGRAQLQVIALAVLITSFCSRAEVVAVVSSKSAITALSKSQVADIFLGRAIRFPDGTLAVPIDQAVGSIERNQFYIRVADRSPAQIAAYWSKMIFTGRGEPPRDVANGIEMKQRIVANPSAIGYIDDKLVDGSVRVLL
jgi:ABC-type phosphate transport system substrate-binding protein